MVTILNLTPGEEGGQEAEDGEDDGQFQTGVSGGHLQAQLDSQVAAVSFDAFGGAEALAVVGVAHASVAVTLAGWSHRETQETGLKQQGDGFKTTEGHRRLCRGGLGPPSLEPAGSGTT